MVLPFSRWCGYQALQAADLLGHVVTTGWLHIIKASPKQLHPPSPSRAAQGHWGRPPDPHHRGRRSSRRPQNPKKESWVKWTNCNCWDQWPPPIKQDTVSFSVLLSTLPWRSLAIQWAERSQHCWKISPPTRVFSYTTSHSCKLNFVSTRPPPHWMPNSYYRIPSWLQTVKHQTLARWALPVSTSMKSWAVTFLPL